MQKENYNTPSTHRNNAILKLPEVKTRTGLSRSTIYHRIKEGTFPRQIKLGARASGWLESELDSWIEDRIAESRAEVA